MTDGPVSTNPHAWRLADLDRVPRNGVRVLSTFSCGGGSCMGYKRAGCEVVGANDCDPEMRDHYVRNLHPPHFHLCTVGDMAAREGDRWRMALPYEPGSIDILDGSPPCSSFSPSGAREKSWGTKKRFREGQVEQVLNDLFYDYLALVGRLRPRVSIAENVTGMLLGNAKGYLKGIFERYRAMGYHPQLFQVDAADCGVPQARRRVFFCAVRGDWAAERGLGALSLDTPWFRRPHVTTTEACDDLGPLTAEEIEDTAPAKLDLRWWHLTRPGENYASAIQRAGLPNQAWNWIRHPAHRPACTLISAWRCMAHWSECRKLTLREFLRLGSFPDDYWTSDTDRGRYLVGMSVPPRMTEAVARAVCEQWLGTPPQAP